MADVDVPSFVLFLVGVSLMLASVVACLIFLVLGIHVVLVCVFLFVVGLGLCYISLCWPVGKKNVGVGKRG